MTLGAMSAFSGCAGLWSGPPAPSAPGPLRGREDAHAVPEAAEGAGERDSIEIFVFIAKAVPILLAAAIAEVTGFAKLG